MVPPEGGEVTVSAECECPEGVLELDGSFGEGGGQVLRNSTSLAAILHRNIRICNVRFKRPKPGLRPQHLTGVRAAIEISRAVAVGAKENSMELEFFPQEIVAQDLTFDIRTAGACTLITQILLPIMLFADKEMTATIIGGTNVDFSPPVEYIDQVICQRVLPLFGVHGQLNTLSRGYFPRGGGRIELHTAPLERGACLTPVDLVSKGEIVSVRGLVHVVDLPKNIAERMYQAAWKKIRRYFRRATVDIQISTERGPSKGTGIFLMAESDTGALYAWNEMGKIGTPAEQVGENCVEGLATQVDGLGCVDEHLQDQLIIFMMLAEGTSRIRVSEITEHTETSLHFCKLVSKGDYSIEEDGPSKIITVQGIGKQRE